MYVILTYDVAAKRDNKVMKTCRRYLTHDQKSVFEGTLSDAELGHLKKELTKLINTKEDSINIYEFETMKYSTKEKIGVNQDEDNIL